MGGDQILSKYEDKLQTLGYELREFIIHLLPAIKETIDIPANMLAYGYGNTYKESICAIIPSKKGIKLAINRGTELPDPEGLLAGTGKLHKYVEIKSTATINNPAVKALLEEAYKAYQNRIHKS